MYVPARRAADVQPRGRARTADRVARGAAHMIWMIMHDCCPALGAAAADIDRIAYMRVPRDRETS